MNSESNPSPRQWLYLSAWILVCSLVFRKPLSALIQYALNNDNASHILIIPCIVAWLIYLDKRTLASSKFDLPAGSLFAIPAIALAILLILRSPKDSSLALAGLILAFLLLTISGFVAFLGRGNARKQWFALAFLGFAIPFPEPLLDRIIYYLQAGSADVAELIFDWSGIPAMRDGFFFRLPRLSIEVAKECSGIRSSIALLILALLVAHFSFSKFWKKALFIIAGLLMMIVKNGVRIATLTILANYVDPGFLFGRLHKEGGVVFFLLGLALLLPVYWLLRRGESRPALVASEVAPT